MGNNPNSMANLKPFKPGDVRINRRGRPKVADELRALLLEVLHEKALTTDGASVTVNGHAVTNIELIIRQMIRNPRLFEQVLNRAYGKVPDNVKVSGVNDTQIEIVTRVVYTGEKYEPVEPAHE